MSVTSDEGRTHWHGCEREHGHHACALAELARLRAELADAKTLLALFVEHWTTEYTSYLKRLERHEELVNRARDLLAQEPPA